MNLIYIAHPFGGLKENVDAVEKNAGIRRVVTEDTE